MIDQNFIKQLLAENKYEEIIEYFQEEYLKLFRKLFEKNNIEKPKYDLLIDYVQLSKIKLPQLNNLIKMISYSFFSEDDLSNKVNVLFECYPILYKEVKK